jgi:hypothetical protein
MGRDKAGTSFPCWDQEPRNLFWWQKSKSYLIGFNDADFASDTEKRKSTTGFMFQFHGGEVSWGSNFFIRYHQELGTLKMVKIPTDDQVADIFTKPLAKKRFERLQRVMGI